MNLYEALFLIEAGRAAREWEQTEGELLGILEKHGGSVKEKARYDERKLAYPVKGARRGAYLLTYFEDVEWVVPDSDGKTGGSTSYVAIAKRPRYAFPEKFIKAMAWEFDLNYTETETLGMGAEAEAVAREMVQAEKG